MKKCSQNGVNFLSSLTCSRQCDRFQCSDRLHLPECVPEARLAAFAAEGAQKDRVHLDGFTFRIQLPSIGHRLLGHHLRQPENMVET